MNSAKCEKCLFFLLFGRLLAGPKAPFPPFYVIIMKITKFHENGLKFTIFHENWSFSLIFTENREWASSPRNIDGSGDHFPPKSHFSEISPFLVNFTIFSELCPFSRFRVFAQTCQNTAFFEPGPGSRPLAHFSYRRKLVCRGGKEGGREGGVATTAAVKEEREQRRNSQNVTSVS